MRLDRIAAPEGDRCTVTLANVEWDLIKLYAPIDKLAEDSGGVLVIDVPLTNSTKPPGLLGVELKNERGWKGLKLLCRERVLLFGNDQSLLITAGPQSTQVVQVFRASSATTSMKDSVRIEEQM